MENKLTIGILAAALARNTGKSKKLCEDFIREFFKVAAEGIEKDSPLRIKGFGTFKVVDVESREGVNVNTGERHEIAPHRKVVFTPAKELAARINEPFEDFETVEIDDELPDEIFVGDEADEPDIIAQETPEEENFSDENTVAPPILEAGSEEEGEDDDITAEAYSMVEKEQTEKIPTPEIPQEPQEIPENVPLPIYYEEQPAKSRFGFGFLTGALSTFAVCAVIFMLGCFFDWWPVNFGWVKDMEGRAEAVEQPVIPIEETVEEPEPVEEPVYDTVSTTRYLTTISRDHYGDFNFWPYIYMENESILGHPDRITPGTQVMVPPLSKYGVDPSNPDDVKTAKRKGVEIYARFK